MSTETATTPEDDAYVSRRKTAAYWFAAGWSEATGEPDRAQEFAEFAAAQATAYRGRMVWHLGSVISQWAEFNATA